MAHFIFKAKKANGEIHKSEMDAKDRYDLYKMIKETGEEVIDVREKSSKALSLNKLNFNLPFLHSIKSQDKITFARNLGAMLKAGLALSKALFVMEKQAKNKELKKILVSLQKSISEGKTLSESMTSFGNVFSQLFISMVSAGEQSGTLAEALRVIGLQMDKTYSLQRKIRGAMMYPAVILFAMILIAILMLTYIVPTLMKTFTELNVALPASTRFVMTVSNLIVNHGILVLSIVLIIVGLIMMWSKRMNGKKVIHYFILKIPIIGNLIKEVNTARTARTLSSLLSSGVDMVESVKITKDVLQNIYYKAILEKAGEEITKGEPMSKIFTENDKFYPLFLGEMMNVGEETGKIGEMLLSVAVFYEEDVEQKTKDMSTIIEPFLMIAIAVVVGFFAVAMISPMYSLVNVI